MRNSSSRTIRKFSFIKRNLLLAAALFLIVLVVYLPVLRNGFTNWDDESYVMGNLAIRNLSWQGVWKIFTAHEGLYKPLSILSFAIEYRFFGLNPFIYHLDNLLLHLINTLLVFWLIGLLRPGIGVAFLTALLFGIHPVHAESVAWITERKDVLFSVFTLSSLVAYSYYCKNKNLKYYFLALFLFFVSLLAKPMGITLPFILFLIDAITKRGFNRAIVKEKTAFFVILFVFAIVGMIAAKLGPRYHTNLLDNFFIFCASLLFYIKQTLFPLFLSAYYPMPEKTGSFFSFAITISPLLAFALGAGIWATRRFTKKIFFGALFFFITISLPCVMTFKTEMPYFAADRYLYIPALGIFYILAEGLAWLVREHKSGLKIFCIILVSVFFSWLIFLAHERIGVWKDSLSLWEDALKKYPDQAGPYLNRGLAYQNKGDFDQAISDYTRALEIRPNTVEAYLDRGLAYQYKGQFDQALADFNRALALEPNGASIYNNRGGVYEGRGDFESALSDYTKAIELAPNYVNAYSNRGGLYAQMGQFDHALSDYGRALAIEPDLPDVYFNRGLAYMGKGDFDQALQDCDAAIRFKPNFAEAYRMKGDIFVRMGDFNQALWNYDASISIAPNYAGAYSSRAVLYYNRQEYAKSWDDVARAQALGGQINPQFIELLKKASGR